MSQTKQTVSREGMIQLIAAQLPQEPALLRENLEKSLRIHFISRFGGDRLDARELKQIITRVQEQSEKILGTAAGYDADTKNAQRHIAHALATAIDLWLKEPASAEYKTVTPPLASAKPSVPRALRMAPDTRTQGKRKAAKLLTNDQNSSRE